LRGVAAECDLSARSSPAVAVSNTDSSIDTLVSISGTMAGIGLALVGILAAKSSMDGTETVADDLFLFSSLGFLVVLALGYLAQKETKTLRVDRLVSMAEWVFSVSLLLTVVGAFVLVYAEI